MPAPVDAAATSTFLGAWGKPPDTPAWVALGVAALLLALAATPGGSAWCAALLAKHVPHRRAADTISTRRYLTILGFLAAFLSLGYIAYYLRGGPRIIDATSYFLQGRALSHGQFSWAIPDPSASFRGRFLLFQEPDRLGGIFPPGYPLLLAAGFLIGAPMVIGPMLAAGIVILTYVLAREMAQDERRRQPFYVPEPESVARFAAAISVVCATLRYHTADTMAHGACALAMLIALASAIRARRANASAYFALAGLAVGYVAATRPASSVAIGLVVLWIAARTKTTRAQNLAGLALGVVPGLLLLLAANRSVAGSAFTFPQTAYYAVSDGPPGCFRYGFGKSVGCLHEHGDFVGARLPHGYGVLE
ncbi:MAG: hypothetical protein JWM74_341, partial [Myxococcaceae bacterium]|nr:hypothetical protein [Myxococcaceae bacterium]